jgi:hypothetical protein
MLPLSLKIWLSSLILGRHKCIRRGGSDPWAGGPPPDARIDFLGRIPLTRPPSPSLNSGSSVSSQAQCSLCVLSLEIRQQIWESALGGHTFHLVMREERLAACYCVSADPTTCNRGYGGCRVGFTGDLPAEIGQLLSLLLACKQM